jgi:hypothetical protein
MNMPIASSGGFARWFHSIQPYLRTLHRDLGCLAVGLTVVYALSGIAVNHIKDWDPNFTLTTTDAQLEPGFPTNAEALSAAVVKQLGLQQTPEEIYVHPSRELVILGFSGGGQLQVNTATGHITGEAQSPRFMLRAMNWLHVQRGKPAWNWIADTYAIVLLLLAVTGICILPRGGRGIIGRGGLLLLAGIAVPLVYLLLAGE